MVLDHPGQHRNGELPFHSPNTEARRPGDVMSLYREYDRSLGGQQGAFVAKGKEPLFVQFENAHMFPRMDGIADLQGKPNRRQTEGEARTATNPVPHESDKTGSREQQLEHHRSQPSHHESAHHHHKHHEHHHHGRHHHHHHYGHMGRHHHHDAGSPDGGKHHRFADGAYDSVKAPDGPVLAESVKIVLKASKELGLDAKTTRAAIASMLIESKGNPHAIGDGNTSFGLFQLHKGGELTEAHLTPQQAFDPLTNARVALKYFKQQQDKGVSDPGALAAAAQRPKYRQEYAGKVNSNMAAADELIRKYGGSEGAV